jgi:hypothetical protein
LTPVDVLSIFQLDNRPPQLKLSAAPEADPCEEPLIQVKTPRDPVAADGLAHELD